jgi:SAM-dependent methyltransferase
MQALAEKLDDFLLRYLAYFNYRSYTQRMNLQGNEKGLEIGSGGGNLSRLLAKRLSQGRLVCIDNSEYWIEKAKGRLRNFRNIEFRLEDILDFNERGYFDAVIIHYVLHDILKEKRENVAGILSRSLKSKGLIYIREPTRKNHGMPFEEIRSLMLKNGLSEQGYRVGYSFPARGKFYEGVFQKR